MDISGASFYNAFAAPGNLSEKIRGKQPAKPGTFRFPELKSDDIGCLRDLIIANAVVLYQHLDLRRHRSPEDAFKVIVLPDYKSMRMDKPSPQLENFRACLLYKPTANVYEPGPEEVNPMPDLYDHAARKFETMVEGFGPASHASAIYNLWITTAILIEQKGERVVTKIPNERIVKLSSSGSADERRLP